MSDVTGKRVGHGRRNAKLAGSPLGDLLAEDLSPMGLEELTARIGALESEMRDAARLLKAKKLAQRCRSNFS